MKVHQEKVWWTENYYIYSDFTSFEGKILSVDTNPSDSNMLLDKDLNRKCHEILLSLGHLS